MNEYIGKNYYKINKNINYKSKIIKKVISFFFLRMTEAFVGVKIK